MTQSKKYLPHDALRNIMAICGLILWLGSLVPESSAQQNEPQQFVIVTEDGSGEVRIEEYHETHVLLPPIAWLGLFLSGVCLAYALYVYQQIRRPFPLSEKERQYLFHERQRLLQQLADFDTLYAQGKIQAEQYASERQPRKQQLIHLTILCQKEQQE